MFSDLGGRDARPCVTTVRYVIIERCPASALRGVGPGPLVDASESVSLVVAFMIVSYVFVSSCMWLTLCDSFVK